MELYLLVFVMFILSSILIGVIVIINNNDYTIFELRKNKENFITNMDNYDFSNKSNNYYLRNQYRLPYRYPVKVNTNHPYKHKTYLDQYSIND